VARKIPQKDLEAKLRQGGRAWGHGKRKTCTALASVRAGSGKIKVNGKPLLQYFHDAS